ncbi:archease [Candidatus Coxiella mudrowiae]|uniref:archease n=1 Tax=Candidatus Coxiella mudrowiae TaxID=2054173 RepID=UPI001F2A4874|nr:archease [Candidatus Coxiella mudrowiae]
MLTWLNRLVAEARANNLIFSHFELSHQGEYWKSKGVGEKWTEETVRGTEVKGARLTMLSVKKENSQWEAKYVVDV